MNKIIMYDWFVPVTSNRLLNQLSLWGSDHTQRNSYYSHKFTSVTMMYTGYIEGCKAHEHPYKSVKGMEITFSLKAENAIAYGNSLVWFDKKST